MNLSHAHYCGNRPSFSVFAMRRTQAINVHAAVRRQMPVYIGQTGLLKTESCSVA